MQTATIEVRRMLDTASIARTLTHARIYGSVTDDSAPAPADVERCLDPERHLYLGCYDGEAYLGLFMVHQHNGVMFEAHTCLLPAAWGEMAVRCCAQAMAWMFENTPCERLITSVPRDNVLALRLARRAGMTQWGVNPGSIKRGGVLVDQIMFGISRGEACQQ